MRKIRLSNILIWMGCGLVVGGIVGSLVCLTRPKRYESRAVLVAGGTDERVLTLPPMRAAQIVKLLHIEEKWAMPKAEAVAILCEATTLRSRAGKVEIVTRSTFPEDARDIAGILADVFRDMNGEVALTGRSPASKLSALEKEETAIDRARLSSLLNTQAREAGFLGRWDLEMQAQSGVPDARRVWDSESFQRQRTLLLKLMDENLGISLEPRGSAPRLIEAPIIASSPASPVVIFYSAGGQLMGALLGGMLGLRRERKLARAPLAPVPPRVPEKSSRPVAQQRREDIEDEW